MRYRRKSALIVLTALLVASVCAGAFLQKQKAQTFPLGNRIANSEQIVSGIRNGLRHHSAKLTIRFDYGSAIFEELNDVVDEWMEAALAETGQPDEGDYIRYQYGGYTYHSSYVIRDGRWYYTVEIAPVYYCTLRQYREAEEALQRVLGGLASKRKSSADILSYERIGRISNSDREIAAIRAAYEYVCGTVKYDKPHRKNPYYHLCSTAYAALVQHTATCQGYCVTLYRLLREQGIDCRIITGSAGEERLHAWVIARVGDSWYQLDPTWDAGADPNEFRYFLVGTKAIADHVPEERFQTEAFLAAYPQPEDDL